MHDMEKKLIELHEMVKIAWQDIKKVMHQVFMVHNKTKFKKGYWTKKKARANGKDKYGILNPATDPKPVSDSKTMHYYCKETGTSKGIVEST